MKIPLIRLLVHPAVAVTFCCVMPHPASSQNLVTNPGFETGDFSGWNFYTSQGSTVVSSHFAAHTGLYYANFGDFTYLPGNISQSLSTTPGQEYQLDFYLANIGEGVNAGPNQFIVSEGTDVLADLIDIPTQPYTDYTYEFVATGASTDLRFAGGDNPFALFLDDVSVVAITSSSAVSTPEPGSIAMLVGCGIAGAGFAARRRKRALRQ
jgi:hypothetical protein